MARVTIESQAAPAVQGPLETAIQDLVVLTMVLGACLALAQPGILIGAGVAALWRWRTQPSRARRVLRSVLVATPLLWLHPLIAWAWPWRNLLAQGGVLPVAPVTTSAVLHSVAVEALAGPLWLKGALLVARLRQRTVHAQIRRDHRLDQQRWRAIIGGHKSEHPTRDPKPALADSSELHPDGYIRIGLDLETGAPLDLSLPSDLAAHAFLPGASGSGKTNTLSRLADGALANGYGVVIIDCKAGNLGRVARSLANRYRTPFRIVDPDHPESLGYNPCTGDAPAVANKLVGTFTFGSNAEIYKHIAMETMSVAVRGLHAAGERVTLESLYATFGPRGLSKLANRITSHDRLRKRLLDLDPPDVDRLGAAGRAGLQRRLGALLEGKFGELFHAQPALDWTKAVAEPSVTYLALSALASSEDVDLMGRVIVQDLKQLCARRLRQLSHGLTLTPIVLVIDEFAALDEPEQLLDLLRQAREALVTIVLSTQHMPETYALQQACLGAGLIVAHRVSAPDAEMIAAQFGTRPANDITHQIDYASGVSEKGSIRRVDKFHVHPNELREFVPGQAALKCVAHQRYTIVRVYLDNPQRTTH
jgi:Type IV secretion-system coupling protein DNA-binding domain